MSRSPLLALFAALALGACTAPALSSEDDVRFAPIDAEDLRELSIDVPAVAAQPGAPLERIEDLDGAELFLDTGAMSELVEHPDDPGEFPGATTVSIQCYEVSTYPNQLVTHRGRVCVPSRGGGTYCFDSVLTYRVNITCDTFLYCQSAPPNEDRCSYSMGGYTYCTTRPAGDPSATLVRDCPGTGNPDACSELGGVGGGGTGGYIP